MCDTSDSVLLPPPAPPQRTRAARQRVQCAQHFALHCIFDSSRLIFARMAEQDGAPAPPAPVLWEGKTYKPLADGKYDCIILGTGLKECVLSGLLAVKVRRRNQRRAELSAQEKSWQRGARAVGRGP